MVLSTIYPVTVAGNEAGREPAIELVPDSALLVRLQTG
jgi:hypothetical protein